jgi:hypothetical protein
MLCFIRPFTATQTISQLFRPFHALTYVIRLHLTPDACCAGNATVTSLEYPGQIELLEHFVNHTERSVPEMKNRQVPEASWPGLVYFSARLRT